MAVQELTKEKEKLLIDITSSQAGFPTLGPRKGKGKKLQSGPSNTVTSASFDQLEGLETRKASLLQHFAICAFAMRNSHWYSWRAIPLEAQFDFFPFHPIPLACVDTSERGERASFFPRPWDFREMVMQSTLPSPVRHCDTPIRGQGGEGGKGPKGGRERSGCVGVSDLVC